MNPRPAARGAVVMLAVLVALAAVVHRPAVAVGLLLTLTPDTGPPTTVTAARGSGFAPGERVFLTFDRRGLKTVRASDGGTFAAKIMVPASARPGEHKVSARGQSSGTATATFTVRTDWPTFHFNPARTGENPYENVLGPSNVGDLQVTWATDLDFPAWSAPALVDGVLYAGARHSPGPTHIYALDPAGGEVIWERIVSGNGPSDITVWVDGVVYTGADDHSVYAFDAETGEVRWGVETGDKIFATPAVVFGVAYVGSTDDHLYAFDTASGEVLWKVQVNGGAVNENPIVAAGVVYSGSKDRNLYAFDAATGEVLWSYRTGNVPGDAIVADGTVYLGSSDHFMYAFRVPGASFP